MANHFSTPCPDSPRRSWTPRIQQFFGARLLTTALAGTIAFSGVILTAPQNLNAQSQEQMEQARDAFIKASQFFENEDYLAAAEEFLNAYKLSNRSALLYNVGQAYRLAEKYDEAEQYLQQYLVEQPDAPNADEVAETVINIQQAIAASMASLSIETKPSGQDVFFDDESTPRCQSPCNLTIAAGEYSVHVRPEGWAPRSRTVRLAAGEKNQVRMELERVRQDGSLLVQTDIRQGTLRIAPNIELSLPISAPVKLPPGDHTVELAGSKRAVWTGTVNIQPNETTEILVPMLALTEARAASSPLKIAAYGLGGASLGLITGAVIMGMQADNTHAALQTQRQAFGVVDADLLDQGKNEQFSANVLYGAGAGVLVTAAGLFVWDMISNSPPKADQKNSSNAPTQTNYPQDSKSNVDLLD